MIVSLLATSTLPTRFGSFMLHVFADETGQEHMALAAEQPRTGCLVRLHSECATGDILGSLRCDCRDQLEESLRRIAQEGGLLIYLKGHEGRGIGLTNKIKAYALQEAGLDTIEANLHLGFPMDARDYKAATAILTYFGIDTLRLLTNNPLKVAALQEAGLIVEETVPLWTALNPHNKAYIETKKRAMGHGG